MAFSASSCGSKVRLFFSQKGILFSGHGAILHKKPAFQKPQRFVADLGRSIVPNLNRRDAGQQCRSTHRGWHRDPSVFGSRAVAADGGYQPHFAPSCRALHSCVHVGCCGIWNRPRRPNSPALRGPFMHGQSATSSTLRSLGSWTLSRWQQFHA